MSDDDRQYPICSLSELTDPGTYEFSVGDGEWPLKGVVVRFQGQIHAYENSARIWACH